MVWLAFARIEVSFYLVEFRDMSMHTDFEFFPFGPLSSKCVAHLVVSTDIDFLIRTRLWPSPQRLFELESVNR
jgi:hypothetical protein